MTKEILKLVPTLYAVKLVEHNLNYSKKKKKNIVKLGAENIIATSLLWD